MTLRKIFENEVSSSAFQVIDCETRIVGKFAQISLIGDRLFDIWLVRPSLQPLSTRKLNSIIKRFPQEAKFLVLTGEAYTQVRDVNIVIENLSLLGIKRKRKLSPEAREKLITQLKIARDLPPSAPISIEVDTDEDQEFSVQSEGAGQIQSRNVVL